MEVGILMEFIKGFTFGWDSKKGDFYKVEAKTSLPFDERANE